MDLDFWVGVCKLFAFITFIYWGFSYFQMKKDYDKLLRVVANCLKEKMYDNLTKLKGDVELCIKALNKE